MVWTRRGVSLMVFMMGAALACTPRLITPAMSGASRALEGAAGPMVSCPAGWGQGCQSYAAPPQTVARWFAASAGATARRQGTTWTVILDAYRGQSVQVMAAAGGSGMGGSVVRRQDVTTAYETLLASLQEAHSRGLQLTAQPSQCEALGLNSSQTLTFSACSVTWEKSPLPLPGREQAPVIHFTLSGAGDRTAELNRALVYRPPFGPNCSDGLSYDLP